MKKFEIYADSPVEALERLTVESGIIFPQYVFSISIVEASDFCDVLCVFTACPMAEGWESFESEIGRAHV